MCAPVTQLPIPIHKFRVHIILIFLRADAVYFEGDSLIESHWLTTAVHQTTLSAPRTNSTTIGKCSSLKQLFLKRNCNVWLHVISEKITVVGLLIGLMDLENLGSFFFFVIYGRVLWHEFLNLIRKLWHFSFKVVWHLLRGLHNFWWLKWVCVRKENVKSSDSNFSPEL